MLSSCCTMVTSPPRTISGPCCLANHIQHSFSSWLARPASTGKQRVHRTIGYRLVNLQPQPARCSRSRSQGGLVVVPQYQRPCFSCRTYICIFFLLFDPVFFKVAKLLLSRELDATMCGARRSRRGYRRTRGARDRSALLRGGGTRPAFRPARPASSGTGAASSRRAVPRAPVLIDPRVRPPHARAPVYIHFVAPPYITILRIDPASLLLAVVSWTGAASSRQAVQQALVSCVPRVRGSAGVSAGPFWTRESASGVLAVVS